MCLGFLVRLDLNDPLQHLTAVGGWCHWQDDAKKMKAQGDVFTETQLWSTLQNPPKIVVPVHFLEIRSIASFKNKGKRRDLIGGHT